MLNNGAEKKDLLHGLPPKVKAFVVSGLGKLKKLMSSLLPTEAQANLAKGLKKFSSDVREAVQKNMTEPVMLKHIKTKLAGVRARFEKVIAKTLMDRVAKQKKKILELIERLPKGPEKDTLQQQAEKLGEGLEATLKVGAGETVITRSMLGS